MGVEKLNNLIPNDNGEGKKELLTFIVKQVEKGSGFSLLELKEKYDDEVLFFVALKHVTITKKALIKALNLDVDNACRYKRTFELKGLLKESVNKVVCPYTGKYAKLLSTNPNEFGRLTYSDQLRLF